MYRVQIFKNTDPDAIQQSINEWFQLNKDISVHGTNLVTNESNLLASVQHVFYVLYTSPDNQKEELNEMAAVVTHEQSVEAKEMNADILKPSS